MGDVYMSKQIDKTNILNYLKEHYSEFQDKYNVNSFYLFGSYARDEQTDDSDIDLLVDFDKTPDLLTFIELEELLSNSLQKHVDLIPKRKLKMAIKDQVLKEAIAI
jgi:predicted nucleotidyltransferase